jgi:hypothetical protein
LKTGSTSNSKGKAMNKLYKVANALFDCSSGVVSTDIDSARFSHIRKQEFYRKRRVIPILAIVIYSLTVFSPIYAGENIEVTLRNFFDVKAFYGDFKHFSIVEKGVPVSSHILIVKSCHFLDDARDDKGNDYYFYMVDRPNGLKALISTKELYPVEKLDEKTKEFVQVVKEEIGKDGGIDAIIKKFKKSTQVPGQHI